MEKAKCFSKKRCCYIFIKQGAIKSADFTRIKSVNCFFKRMMQYIIAMRKKVRNII